MPDRRCCIPNAPSPVAILEALPMSFWGLTLSTEYAVHDSFCFRTALHESSREYDDVLHLQSGVCVCTSLTSSILDHVYIYMVKCTALTCHPLLSLSPPGVGFFSADAHFAEHSSQIVRSSTSISLLTVATPQPRCPWILTNFSFHLGRFLFENDQIDIL